MSFSMASAYSSRISFRLSVFFECLAIADSKVCTVRLGGAFFFLGRPMARMGEHSLPAGLLPGHSGGASIVWMRPYATFFSCLRLRAARLFSSWSFSDAAVVRCFTDG